MSLADEIDRDFEEQRQQIQQRQDAIPIYESVSAITALLSDPEHPPPKRIGLDMLLLAKEAFDGGWTLWLTSKELKDVLETKGPKITALAFDKKAKYVFRLAVWQDKKREAHMTDVKTAPDGADIRADRVTGLHLFKDKLAQGNTSHVTVVGDDPPSAQDGKKTTKR